MRYFALCLGATAVLFASVPDFARGDSGVCNGVLERLCESFSKRVDSIADDSYVADPEFASTTVLNTYRSFEPVQEQDVCKGGYARLKFDLVEGANADLSVKRVKNFGERSFIDWLTRLVKSQKGTYLLSVSVYGDVDPTPGERSGLIGFQPIFSYTTSDSLKEIATGVKFDLRTDSLAFPVSCDEQTGEFDVEVALHKSLSDDITTENIQKLFSAASDFASAVSSGASLVDATVVSTANGALQKIEDVLLGEFTTIQSVSIRENISLKQDGIKSVEYDLLAPHSPGGRFKVQLRAEYESSLLLSGGNNKINRSGDIVAKSIYFSNGEYKTLSEYIQAHPRSADDWDRLSDPSSKLLPICEEFQKALDGRLRQLDQTIAINALANRNMSKFVDRWDPACLGAEGNDLNYLRTNGVTIMGETSEKIPDLHQQSIDLMSPIIEVLSGAIKTQSSEPTVVSVFERSLDRESNSEQITFVDETLSLVPFAGNGIQVRPSALLKIFVSEHNKFLKHSQRNSSGIYGIGCYKPNPIVEPEVDLVNQVGSLTVVNGKPLEMVWYFEERPIDRSSAVLRRLVVRNLTDDAAKKYSDGRLEVGCGDYGFKPWEYLGARVADTN